MNIETSVAIQVFLLILEIVIFCILTLIGKFVVKKMRNTHNRFLNPREFLPEDEIHTLRQVFYLILMALSFIMVLYSLTFNSDYIYLAIFDIAVSLFIAVTLDIDSHRNKILLLLLIPYGSLSYSLFDFALAYLVDIVHILIFIYFIKYYYGKFREYTHSNGLGFAIILLFTIIFVSFFVTQVVENVNALDSLVMVSNAFTSNGYAILGHTIPGKLNSLFLVWGGYILSGVGTATLTASILIVYFNKQLRKLEKLIEEGNDDNG